MMQGWWGPTILPALSLPSFPPWWGRKSCSCWARLSLSYPSAIFPACLLRDLSFPAPHRPGWVASPLPREAECLPYKEEVGKKESSNVVWTRIVVSARSVSPTLFILYIRSYLSYSHNHLRLSLHIHYHSSTPAPLILSTVPRASVKSHILHPPVTTTPARSLALPFELIPAQLPSPLCKQRQVAAA